jgi:hypothetical protein
MQNYIYVSGHPQAATTLPAVLIQQKAGQVSELVWPQQQREESLPGFKVQLSLHWLGYPNYTQ